MRTLKVFFLCGNIALFNFQGTQAVKKASGFNNTLAALLTCIYHNIRTNLISQSTRFFQRAHTLIIQLICTSHFSKIFQLFSIKILRRFFGGLHKLSAFRIPANAFLIFFHVFLIKNSLSLSSESAGSVLYLNYLPV
jgi:hypothetical protein